MRNLWTRAAARAFALSLAANALLHAQDASPSRPGNGERRATPSSTNHALRVPSAQAAHRVTAIALDGKLDDAAWQTATPVTEFTQVDPDPDKPASQRTEVRFMFDGDALYIGAKMHDIEGRKGVRTSLVRRDQPFNSDYIEIVIDGFHDHLGSAFFDLNPSGSKQDQLGVGTSCCDSGWDPVWDAATHIDDDGWTAEIRIPLSQLRFSTDSVQTWGLQLRRFIQRRNELDQWSYWTKNEIGGPQRFGHLEGLEIRSDAKKSLELLPYVVGRTSHTSFDEGDPFNSGAVQSARAGLDLKYLLNNSLTIDVTFNPDFGQVEVDPAVINLSAFETSFPEKRPFFIAESGVFNFGGFRCFFCIDVAPLSAFYSRRIGRAPTGADLAYSRGKYADVPDATEIIGAAKITGRTTDGWTVGVLDAVTNRATARIQLGDGSRATQEVEPLTNYFVGRVKKDLLRGNLVVGGIATLVERQMDSTFAPRLNSHSEFMGGDWVYRWKNQAYSWMGNVGLSSINGSAREILGRERSSARYFQRPDRAAMANGFFTSHLDSTLTTMRGGALYSRVAKSAGGWMWEGALDVRTPGFENNDLGFLTRSDFVSYSANLVRHYTTPTRWYREFWLDVGGTQQNNFSNDLTDQEVHSYAQMTLLNFWSWNATYVRKPALDDDRLLRGGPVVERPGTRYTGFSLTSDNHRALIWSGNVDYAWTQKGGWVTDWSTNLQYRPSSQVSVSFGPSWSDSQSLLQFVTAVADPTDAAFYGSRYVLSAIKQKNLALDTRLSVTFTPNMTLELYAQPFIASGQYVNFKEFNAPRSGEFSIFGRDKGTLTATRGPNGLVTSYTIDPDGAGPAKGFTIGNPDFNYRSLRGNAVFRWEYHPGSTLYLAWTQSRSDTEPLGDFNFRRDFSGLSRTRPDNIFLVKASWWLAR